MAPDSASASASIFAHGTDALQAVPDSELQWPPRSPHEALLSTPGGRQRYRQMLNRTSPSPSPSRKSRPISARGSSPGGRLGIQLDAEDEDDGDDDDEETLQLKLQEIQARLRLKKLQNAAKNKENNPHARSSKGASQPHPSASASASADELGRPARASTPDIDNTPRLAPRDRVQVPASPIRKAQATQQQASPSRVFLGIGKGLTAKDISLKRAPSRKGTGGGSTSQNRGYLESSRSSNLPTATESSSSSQAPRPQSFNERLFSARTEETFRAQRQEKIQNVRTNAFGIGKREMEEYKKSAVDIPDVPLKAPAFTRDQILSAGKPLSEQLSRGQTTSSSHLHSQMGEPSMDFTDKPAQNADAASAEAKEGDDESSSFEPYSCFHLSRRILPHRVLARHVSGKKTLNIKELLRDVKSPDYALPDVEQDIVVFAIVAKKSEPRTHKSAVAKNGLQSEERGKYMVMTLVDLDFELDMFLFDSGFKGFWKLTEGTVVAILNPGIMPPLPGRQDTGRFSLVINSDADTVIEIGSARDLGFCQSVKKDGDVCGAWVNKKRTQFCEFHSNDAIRKQRSTRVEVNSSGFGGGREPRQNKGNGLDGGKKKGPNNYDWETKTKWFASRSYSAADLIDGRDRGPADRKTRSEFLKRNLEAKEKEREMMKQLGRVGNAAGKEYMQRAGQSTANKSLTPSASSQVLAPDGNAAEDARAADVMKSLGLQKGKERAIHLSPVKRKRPESSSQTSSTVSSSAKPSSAYGWGGNLRQKLSSMKEGEKLHRGGKSPVRKKTRFVTDKGIREAGRESLGMDLPEGRVALGADDADDDDELVIVK